MFLARVITLDNNFQMTNVRTRRAVHSINLRLGLSLIEIVSPEEVIEYEE